MANVQSFISPRELLNYLNILTLPGTFGIDWDVIDRGAYYTVLEETPFKVTTLKSERTLKDYLDSIVGTLKVVVPKRSGGYFTYYSLTNEILGANNGFTMLVVSSQRELEDALNVNIVQFIIESHNKTILIV